MKKEHQVPLVSVIIPCYNGERFLREAIQSCFDQTHHPLEIIVIDDGSTDSSLDIIKSYDKAIIWETGANRGGNAARNRGFTLSQGKYIQFLDADDYLLPEKIERDLRFIEQTGADVVYSDVRPEYYDSNGKGVPGAISVTGAKEDILESLLMDWGVSTHALFFRREILTLVGGWDESIRAVQERDLLISIALKGATIKYYPGCFAVFRRYGAVTVSTSNALRLLTSHYAILQKSEIQLFQLGKLSPKYRRALAQGYFSIARAFYDVDRSYYTVLLRKALSLQPDLNPRQSRMYTMLYHLFGFAAADLLASSRRRIMKCVMQR